MSDTNNNYTPQGEEEILLAESAGVHHKIGLVANPDDSEETRFMLTPEACGMLIASGNEISMEAGAGIDINFSDDAYAAYGVKIVDRTKALAMPIVLTYRPIPKKDIDKMKQGATLLCMLDSTLFDPAVIDAFLEKQITVGCFNNMLSHNDEPVFANIIDEIDGRAAIMYAEDHLSFLGGGKGVLLAGVAGINPCEVLIIGTGMKVNYAAIAAIAAGASVTVMDNDVSSLQIARQFCGDHLTTCCIHPNVLINRAKSADVIILDRCTRDFEMPRSLYGAMKSNVYLLNLMDAEPSQSVPRTVTMALSNVLVNFFDEASIKDGLNSMIATTPGVQAGIVTYAGHLVDKLIGSYLGMPAIDISLLISASN